MTFCGTQGGLVAWFFGTPFSVQQGSDITKRRETMGFILGEACPGFVSYKPCFWTRFVPEKAAPTPLVFEDFFEAKGVFAILMPAHIKGPASWWKHYPDSPLAPVAEKLCGLQATTADLERLFSCASFTLYGRENMSPEILKKEVFIR